MIPTERIVVYDLIYLYDSSQTSSYLLKLLESIIENSSGRIVNSIVALTLIELYLQKYQLLTIQYQEYNHEDHIYYNQIKDIETNIQQIEIKVMNILGNYYMIILTINILILLIYTIYSSNI